MIPTSELVLLLIACVGFHAFFVSAEVALSACDRTALRTRALFAGSAALTDSTFGPSLSGVRSPVQAPLAALTQPLLTPFRVSSNREAPVAVTENEPGCPIPPLHTPVDCAGYAPESRTSPLGGVVSTVKSNQPV